ncbi:MAG: CBS domain-containing protein [Rhodospirillales bacterium]|jgi:CBS-domain-containing membrane protein|nr:CBS domain-containing protein [Rhodospirillales bacterium]
MNCADIMDQQPVTLQTEDTVGTAIDMLLKHRLLALPVVDGHGVYQGMFAKSRLFGLLFPVLGSVEELLPQMAMLTDIGAAPDKLPEIRERLRSLSDALVGTYADKTVPTLRPDSPLLAAVMLVYRVRNFVAVVDPDTHKLLGVVSTWDALAKLRG